ncbi:alternative ribosome rescue aminoacyl-tRNA hydrolase ArfB [Rubripirellula reticaptiva]|uniref:Peptidyl-tRNA hydrolase ArfB n=1 Tax=Rubripirellula reticaptiva TaxID=2528013 RepID=A0A5C6EH10_9BACT|nr:alternative ribosome rescue aminoacyl-tRNA hydrolase ArfB [Rubripirellula reticaptiva]TWU49113.1 Peptidyl-tRNA hydrolase ArfB [Rubripirellula reticaptiva]
MPDLYVNHRLTISEKEIGITTARSSGPGGQNVNKVNSKVTMHWSPSACESLDPAWRRRFVARQSNRINREGQLVLHSDKYRDQVRNLADARQKLVDLLLECQDAPTPRKATRPSRASQRRRMDQKTRVSQKKRGRGGSWGNDS